MGIGVWGFGIASGEGKEHARVLVTSKGFCHSRLLFAIEQLWHVIAKPRPDSGPGFFVLKVKVVKLCHVVHFSLGSGTPMCSAALSAGPREGPGSRGWRLMSRVWGLEFKVQGLPLGRERRVPECGLRCGAWGLGLGAAVEQIRHI